MSWYEVLSLVTFALLMIELAVIAGAVGLAVHFWRKVKPTVVPMLSMFGMGPPAEYAEPDAYPHTPPAELEELEGP